MTLQAQQYHVDYRLTRSLSYHQTKIYLDRVIDNHLIIQIGPERMQILEESQTPKVNRFGGVRISHPVGSIVRAIGVAIAKGEPVDE